MILYNLTNLNLNYKLLLINLQQDLKLKIKKEEQNLVKIIDFVNFSKKNRKNN